MHAGSRIAFHSSSNMSQLATALLENGFQGGFELAAQVAAALRDLDFEFVEELRLASGCVTLPMFSHRLQHVRVHACARVPGHLKQAGIDDASAEFVGQLVRDLDCEKARANSCR